MGREGTRLRGLSACTGFEQSGRVVGTQSGIPSPWSLSGYCPQGAFLSLHLGSLPSHIITLSQLGQWAYSLRPHDEAGGATESTLAFIENASGAETRHPLTVVNNELWRLLCANVGIYL